MNGYITKLEFVFLFVALYEFPLAEALYESLGHLCLIVGSDEYKSLQAIISYQATPYPYVANTTNITLTCVGRSVGYVATNQQSFMTEVHLRRNSEIIKECKRSVKERVREITCTTTVSGVKNSDNFYCYMFADKAPCNGARIMFEVQSLIAPTVSPILPTIKRDGRMLQMTCVGSGVPPPRVAWLFNGSISDYKSIERVLNISETQIVDNGTNTYHVLSKLLIKAEKYPLRIQCVVSNEMYRVYSRNVHVIHAEIVNVKLTTASVRWMKHSAINDSSLNATACNISLISGNKYHEYATLCDQMNFTFSNLTMKKVYWVKIQKFININHAAIGFTTFYSPGRLPAPKEVFLQKITSRKAVIRWESISVNTSDDGVLLGYELEVTGNNKTVTFTMPADTSEVVLPHLKRKSNYAITIHGFTQFGDGNILRNNFTTLDVIPAPVNVRISNVSENSAVVRWTAIEQRKEIYDTVLGFTVTIRNKTYLSSINTSIDMSSVSLKNLSPNANYSVSVVGRGEESGGMPSEWISFKTNEFQSNQNEEQNSTNTNVILTVSIVAVVIFLALIIAYLGFRKRKSTNAKNIKPNQMEMQGETRSSHSNNLRILYPEYYDDTSNNAEELQKWEINRSRLILLENVLGGGYFGLVKEGMLLKSSTSDLNSEITPVAVKTLKAHHRQCDWNELLREFEILQHVNATDHRNIIKLIGACSKTVPVLLAMEFCPKGNLKDFLKASRVNEEHTRHYNNIYSKITERQLINFATEIARGMMFLFEKKVVHRDIASRNILLDDHLTPKIADFGLARKIDVTTHYIINKNRLLPVKWMSIESLEEARFTAASDTWSYGVLLWEICTLADEPYQDVSPYDILEYLLQGNRMSRPKHCSTEIFSWMERCWRQDPEKRPSFSEIYDSLQGMLINNERTYINVRPYQDVNETTMLKSKDILEETRSDTADSGLGEDCESSMRESGVYDTSL